MMRPQGSVSGKMLRGKLGLGRVAQREIRIMPSRSGTSSMTSSTSISRVQISKSPQVAVLMALKMRLRELITRQILISSLWTLLRASKQ